MKTTTLLALALSLAASASAFAADKTPASTPASRVEVIYTDPDKFTDVRDGNLGTEKGRDAILAELREYLTRTATKMLKDGENLTFTFTDIDLAGDFEPWRGANFNDVRIVKDIYPPRMSFTYKLTDASGAVVKEGTKELRDLLFQSRLTIDRNDSLRYEKDMLNDFLRSEIRRKA